MGRSLCPLWLAALSATACFSAVWWENTGYLRRSDGQPCPEVLFAAEGSGIRIFVRTQGLSYVFVQTLSAADHRYRILLRRVDVEWIGANPFFSWTGEEAECGYRNFYRPGIAAVGIRAYRSITLHELFPGVALRLSWTKQGMKYDLIAQRAEALASVRFRYVGATSVTLEADGSCRITTELGQLRELPPIAYQSGRPLRAAYVLQGDTLSFVVPEALPHLPLVYDPGVVWSTYYGGSAAEEFAGVATDRAGNVYCVGYSISPDFPVLNALQSTLATTVASDVVIAKFSPAGQPLWATYYGGDSIDIGNGIACDANGNPVVVGTTTSPNFPIQNALQNSLSGASDAFVLRLNSAGQRLWATYYGGSGIEAAFSVAYDRSGGSIFVGGSTNSTNFPVANALQSTYGGGSSDGFLLRLSAAGQRLWATYYGGSGEDAFRGVAGDSTGAVVAVGSTSSTDFAVQNALQPAFAGGTLDGVIVKLNAAGQRVWATYYGGNQQDIINAVAVDSRNCVAVGGASLSDTIPLLNAIQARRAAALDAFLSSLDSLGRLLWGTFYGGNAMEEIRGVAIARNRSVI
ncbi:MAG: SBBP repeat-containing protein, partial [Chlorobiota bacterium]